MVAASKTHDGRVDHGAAMKRINGSRQSKPRPRLTNRWLSKSRKSVEIRDRVIIPDGSSMTVIGRWTKHLNDGTLVPMVTGNAGRKRVSVRAADVRHK